MNVDREQKTLSEARPNWPGIHKTAVDMHVFKGWNEQRRYMYTSGWVFGI